MLQTIQKLKRKVYLIRIPFQEFQYFLRLQTKQARVLSISIRGRIRIHARYGLLRSQSRGKYFDQELAQRYKRRVLRPVYYNRLSLR